MQAFTYEAYAQDGRFDNFVQMVADIFCKQFESYQLSRGYSSRYSTSHSSSFDNVEEIGTQIAQMVTNRTHNDYIMLKQARAAILEGFKESEALYGDYLPSISYRTLETALGKIDKYATHF